MAPADLEDVLLATATEDGSEEDSPGSLEGRGLGCRASSKVATRLIFVHRDNVPVWCSIGSGGAAQIKFVGLSAADQYADLRPPPNMLSHLVRQLLSSKPPMPNLAWKSRPRGIF